MKQLTISMFIAAVFFSVGIAARPLIADLRPDVEPLVSERVAEFEGLNVHQPDVVLLGDSLTERGRWNELLDKEVANRGIGRDNGPHDCQQNT